MLKSNCQGFRQGFSPHDPDSSQGDHRLECEACDAYARRLEDAADLPRRRLPSSLQRRLAAIPAFVMDCDDVDRLYGAVRRRAHGNLGEDAAALDHLAECQRCQGLYRRLEDALTPQRRAMPQRLFERLRQIGRQPPQRLPVWIADTRYATAACYLITALLVLLADDASARFQATSEVVSAQASTWLGHSLDGTIQGIVHVGETLQDVLTSGQAWLTERAESLWQSLTDGAHRLHDRYHQLDLDPRHWFGDADAPISTPIEGESDGRS